VSYPEDRRSLQAELTPAGERILEEMRAAYAAEVERHLGALSIAEAEVLTAALARVTDSTCDEAGATAPSHG
jgi:DNA-binding MarR family transcriptional regulator